MPSQCTLRARAQGCERRACAPTALRPRTAMSYSSTITEADLESQRRRKDECISAALTEGAKSAGLALLVSGSLSQLLKYVSEAYRFKFTTGPRTAVVVMPVFS